MMVPTSWLVALSLTLPLWVASACASANDDSSVVEGARDRTSQNREIRETTQATIGRYLIGVSNIWVRELPEPHGRANRRMSAIVSIFDRSSKRSVEQTVSVGSVIALDGERYRVVDVREGATSPGSITIQRVP